MTQLLPTVGVDFANVDEIIPGQLEPQPPGEYLAEVSELTREGEKVRVTFRLLQAVRLVDGAPAPRVLGQVSKTFPNIGPIPPTAPEEERRRRKASLGIFKGFYRVATGESLSGPTISWDKLKNARLLVRVGWATRSDRASGERAKPYSYSQWLAAGKPDPQDTFFINISGFAAASGTAAQEP